MVKEIEANLCFSIFWQKLVNIQWPPFMGRGNFFENWQEYIAQIPCGSKISTNSRAVKSIEANLYFAIFGQNLKIQNGRHFWGGENFLQIPRVHWSDTLWVDNFDEIALSRTVKEIEGNL